MASTAAALRIAVRQVGGARVVDCGVETPGGLQAGLALARACTAGQADMALLSGTAAHAPCLEIQLTTDHPIAACLAAQYAGWQIGVGKFFAMGSGPMRAAYGKEELFDDIPGREEAPVAVGVLESRKLPGEDVIAYIAERVKLPPENLTLLVAPAASLAGNIQVVARALETALHKLHELKFDLSCVVSGSGIAPLPPVAHDELNAIGRTNDAILYGGRVILWVRAADEQIVDIGPKVPSNASADHGAPFAEIFERYDKDFYKIDPMLFSPAEIVFHNLASGRSHVFGGTEPEVLRKSFFPDS